MHNVRIRNPKTFQQLEVGVGGLADMAAAQKHVLAVCPGFELEDAPAEPTRTETPAPAEMPAPSAPAATPPEEHDGGLT